MRTLSGRGTFFVKIVFPILWFVLGIVFLVIIKDPLPGQGDITSRFLIAWIAGFFVMLLGIGMKRVRMDDAFLYVSNYRTDVKVSLAEIADVTQSTRIAFPTITVHFRTPTAFGSEIRFLTPARFGKLAGTPHPIVDELKQLAHRAALQSPSRDTD